MSSSRLPGKMLKQIGNTTLFDRVVCRAELLDQELVLATSEEQSDDELAEHARELGLKAYRGPLNDVLGRAVSAARHAGFDAFARLCGDRPFLPLMDMQRGLEVMRLRLEQSDPLDLVTTHLPSPVPAGLTTEVIRTDALCRAWEMAETTEQLEHVTTLFYQKPDSFRIHALPTDLRELGSVHLAVDSEQDRQLIGSILVQHPELDLAEHEAAKCWRRLHTAHRA